MLAENEVLQGRYRIIRQLGHGGMGAVYEAEDTKRFGKSVALKEILIDFARIPNLKQQETVRRAFEREAKILTQLEDDAFPKVIDYFLETNRQFLVMELIGGDDLAELLEKQQKPFALEDILNWADQLLDALDYLHTLEMPIIHRDIKPHNLKLTARRRIKLLDFGIAKDTSAVEISSTTANETFIAATLNYSPPEQLLRIPLYFEPLKPIYGEKVKNLLKQAADVRSDIYSLGATLYHLSTNKLPVDAYQRILQIWTGSPDPLMSPREFNPNIPPEISEVLLKSMEIDREKRFASAFEMRTALKQAIFSERQRQEAAEREKWFIEQDKLKRQEERQRIETENEEYLKKEEQRRQAELEEKRRQEADTLPDAAEKHSTEEKIKSSNIIPPPVAQPLPTQPSPPAARLNTVDESDWNKSSDTDASISITSPSYLKGINLEPEKQESPTASAEEKKNFVPLVSSQTDKKKPVWLLPAAAGALFLFGGAGLSAIYMLNNSAAPVTDKNTINSAAAPTPSPSPAPTVAPSISPTNSPAPTLSNNEKPNTAAAPTVSKTPAMQNTVKPPVAKQTPKPKKTPSKDNDCIFTGDC